MLTREIGNSGIKATAVGLGTWAIGGWLWGGTDEEASLTAIKAALDEGISLIDTAPAYGLGVAEEIVGKAIKGRRDQVVLATKCGLVWDTQDGNYFIDQGDKRIHRYLGKQSIIDELDQSLKRLGTDYVDLYLTHWQDPTTPIDETMETLLHLKQDGKIRAIGACNVSPEELKSYVAAGQLDCLQEEYSMVKRDIQDTLLPACTQNGVSMLSYSSLALGLLAGKIGPDRTFDGDDIRKDNPRFSTSNREKIAALKRELAPICEAHNASMAQVIIAWTLQQPGITFSLCGARNLDQARENAAAGRLKLSSGDIVKIDAAAAQHLRHLDT